MASWRTVDYFVLKDTKTLILYNNKAVFCIIGLSVLFDYVYAKKTLILHNDKTALGVLASWRTF